MPGPMAIMAVGSAVSMVGKLIGGIIALVLLIIFMVGISKLINDEDKKSGLTLVAVSGVPIGLFMMYKMFGSSGDYDD